MAENKALLEIMRQKMMKDGMKGLTGGDSATVAPDNRLLPGREGLLREFNRKMHGKGSDYMPGRPVPAMLEPTSPGYVPDEEEEGMA